MIQKRNLMMKSQWVLLINVIFLLLTSISVVHAQPKRLQFNHLTPDDGLSSSITTSILQDYKGFVWIGTHDGLDRYDGFSFVVYKNIPADSTSLGNNLIRTITEDREKNLLIGTQNGLCLYDRKKDRFLNYMLDKSSPLKGINCFVSKIIEDPLGNLWLATSIGLIYFDRIKNQIIQYTYDPNNPGSLSEGNVETVLIDKYNRLWVTTRKGINLFLPATGTFQHIDQVEKNVNELSGILFISMIEDKEGNLWIASNDGLYFLKNKPKVQIADLVHYQHNAHNQYSLSSNLLKSLYCDDIGNIWIGTDNKGLDLFDRENQRFWHYQNDGYDSKSLNNESIETIYQDKTGNLWVGTFTGGLNIAMKNKDAIINYKTLPGAPFSLSHNTVTCFLEDNYSQIWVGTDGGGVNLLDKQTNRFLRFNMDNSNLSSNAILCILEDSNNQIWFGTWGGGLMHYDTKTKLFTSLTTKNSAIKDNSIYAIAEGDNDDLWLGSFENGLIHYQIKEKKFTNYTQTNSGLANKMIIKIAKYSKGRILLGSTNCFQIFSPADNHFVTYMHDPNNANSLSYPTTTDILVENDSCVWIGTHFGLNRFNPNNGSFKRYYEKDGLPSDVIKGLVLDKAGVLWVSTNKGICQFDYVHSIFKKFARDDGLQGDEFYERSILKTKDGALLFGGTKGFNIVYPDRISENKNIPKVLITDLKIFNKSVEPGAENSPLVQNITETKTLILSYKQSVLTFYFAVMDFVAPGKNQYAYKMNGFDKDWIYAGNKREATYTNLNSGEYVLQVKGSNNDGVWNEKGVSLKIIILPPWWKTLWFKFIALLILVLALYSGYSLKLKLYRDKQKELSILVEKRTHEVTLANNQLLQKQTLIKLQTDKIQEANTKLTKLNTTKDRILSIIGHDLRNPFNVVSGFSEILLDEYRVLPPETIEQYLNLISNSSKNGNVLLENLLQWSRTQTGGIIFEPIHLNLLLVAEESYNFLEGDALKKNITIQLQIDPDISVDADENMIKTILRNLLSNAIKFTPEHGSISVKSSLTTFYVEIGVTDSGVGIPEEKIPLLFNIDTNISTRGTSYETGTGLGLILCREFVEKHNGKIWVESKEGVGSQFKFTLPYISF